MKQIVISGLSALIIGFFLWQYGFFSRYNYLSAKFDLHQGTVRVVSFGEPRLPCGDPCIQLQNKYGFRESDIGCVVSGPEIRGIQAYNAQVEKFLDSRNGKGWREQYQAELTDMLK